MAQGRTRLTQLVDAAARASERTGKFKSATMRNVTALAFLLAIIGVVWGLLMGFDVHIVVGLAAIFLGIVSGWAQLSFLMYQRAASGRGPALSIVMTVVSVLVTIVGVILLFISVLTPSAVLFGALAGFVMLAAISLIVAPWLITLVANLGEQRAQTAREQLRLDFTAKLHDSVLQTLALIQVNATDSKKVAALAHAQERELRDWLYGDAKAGEQNAQVNDDEFQQFTDSEYQEVDKSTEHATESQEAHLAHNAEPQLMSAKLKHLVAQVEDTTETQMEVVTVGDTPVVAQLDPLFSAAREAMLNAAHHAAPPYSVYAEVNADLVQVFIRDHGDGFEVNHLPAGHLGVSESILGRMKRAGGTADIDSRPGWGTEVKLALRLSPKPGVGTTEGSAA